MTVYWPTEKARCPDCRRAVGTVNPYSQVLIVKAGPIPEPGSIRHVCQRCNAVFDLVVMKEPRAA